MRPCRIAILSACVALAMLAVLLLHGDRGGVLLPTSASRAPTVTVSGDLKNQAGLPEPGDMVIPPPPRERKSASITGPHGRIVEARSGRPIAGLTVRMSFAGRVLAEEATRADGTFRLPRPQGSRRVVEVITEDWHVSPGRVRLRQEQATGGSGIQFEVERIVTVPVRLRLLDRENGEPIPEFLVRMRGTRGCVEDIVTDADGRLESDCGFEAGALTLELIDHPSSNSTDWGLEGRAVEYQHIVAKGEAAPAEADVRVTIGPTYRFELTLPDDTRVADFYATFPIASLGLFRDWRRSLAGDPEAAMNPLLQHFAKPELLEERVPIRGGDPIWARFRAPIMHIEASEVGDNKRTELHVRSHDGYWSGKTPVNSVEGVNPEVVPIELRAGGAIEGEVLGRDGDALPTAWIQLQKSSSSSGPIREIGADSRGRFAFQWLEAGEYEVRVQTDRYDEWISPVTVHVGSTETVEARLTAAVPLGTVSGVLCSITGQHRSKGGRVYLDSLDNPDFHLSKMVSYRKRDGEYRAAFSFDEVPAGLYELSLIPFDNMRWNTRRMTIAAPAGGLEFVCEDDVPTFDLEFGGIDADTGAPVVRIWHIVWQGDPLDDVRLDDDWESGLYEGVPEGVPLRWVLRAEGYRLAWGDESDIRGGTEHRFIEAALEPGWGHTYKVTTREREPIEGVELIVDGESLGRTDSQGVVTINLDARPEALEFRYEGWHMSWGRTDPTEQGFGWGPETPVYLTQD